MKILLDTNILARCIEPEHLHHQTATRAVSQLINRGDDLCIVPQILYEHFVVCTRPRTENGGLGMSNANAMKEIAGLTDTFKLLAHSPAIFPQWLQLFRQHAVIGKRAHDARIAAMIAGQIPAILTFNLRDFRQYNAIQTLDPAEVVLA